MINDYSKVIGMNTFGHPEAMGINFAVASIEIIDFIENYPINEILPPNEKEKGNKKDWITRKSDWITKKSNSSSCKLDQPVYKEDSNNNGKYDYFEYDGNCNGTADIAVYDYNEDGEEEEIYIDSNENKIFELFISFDVHKGKFFARYLYDVDETGEYEKVCFDIDLDEKVDQCKLIT